MLVVRKSKAFLKVASEMATSYAHALETGPFVTGPNSAFRNLCRRLQLVRAVLLCFPAFQRRPFDRESMIAGAAEIKPFEAIP